MKEPVGKSDISFKGMNFLGILNESNETGLISDIIVSGIISIS